MKVTTLETHSVSEVHVLTCVNAVRAVWSWFRHSIPLSLIVDVAPHPPPC